MPLTCRLSCTPGGLLLALGASLLVAGMPTTPAASEQQLVIPRSRQLKYARANTTKYIIACTTLVAATWDAACTPAAYAANPAACAEVPRLSDTRLVYDCKDVQALRANAYVDAPPVNITVRLTKTCGKKQRSAADNARLCLGCAAHRNPAVLSAGPEQDLPTHQRHALGRASGLRQRQLHRHGRHETAHPAGR